LINGKAKKKIKKISQVKTSFEVLEIGSFAKNLHEVDNELKKK